MEPLISINVSLMDSTCGALGKIQARALWCRLHTGVVAVSFGFLSVMKACGGIFLVDFTRFSGRVYGGF